MTTPSTHPLASATQASIEMAIAQALSELTGRTAQVTVKNGTHSPMYLDTCYSSLEISVSFPQPSPEEGEDGDAPMG